MIPTLGHSLILLSLAAAAAGLVAGSVAGFRNSREAASWARVMAGACAVTLTLATLLLEWALLSNDFSVSYVAQVGSIGTPPLIAAVSLWSSLDGSMLFWSFVAAVYAGVFAWRTRHDEPGPTGWALAVQLAVLLFFTMLVAGHSMPFEAMDPVPSDGPGPNPLLQNHVLMAIHPPTLYLGYVGMAVPFAMAVAALASGRLDASWTRSLRAWSLWVWAFLTLGILLGGWWSYEVLGWGGYWAWDPVENASLLPWLTFTAFLHSLIVAERRGRLAITSLVLVMLSFLLTVLGTFMTRSGVFNSVHSFTQSPIGPAFLAFLSLTLTGSVLLLAARMDKLDVRVGPRPRSAAPASRETAFLLMDLVLLAITATVLLGTLYPLVNQALTGGQVSVGAPYYEKMNVPLLLVLLLLMGLGPALPWGKPNSRMALTRLVPPAVLALAVTVAASLAGLRNGSVSAAVFLCTFAAVVSLAELAALVRARLRAGSDPAPIAVFTGLARSPQRTGAHLAHLGVAMLAVAVAFSSAYRQETEITMKVGETAQWNGYSVGFVGSERVQESHRLSSRASLAVFEGSDDLGELVPALNSYPRMAQSMGTPAVLTRPLEDLYISLVRVGPGQVSLRVFLQPGLLWIWIGGLLMVLGSLVAALPAMRRRRKGQEASS